MRDFGYGMHSTAAALMQRVACLLLPVAVCAAAQAQLPDLACPPPAQLPKQLALTYDASAARGPLVLSGESKLTFARDGERYEFNAETVALGIFRATQRSSGTVRGDVLAPALYQEERTGRPGFLTTIDWSARRVTFAPGGRKSNPHPSEAELLLLQAPAPPLLQDRLSVLLQVGVALRAQPARTSVAFPVAGARRVAWTRFERRDEAPVTLPLGQLASLRYERPLDEDNDRIEVWLAPDACWLPVRIRYTDRKGGVIDHQLRAITLQQ